MSWDHLPEDQARRAEQLFASLKASTEHDLKAIAELLATRPDDRLFGQDRVRSPRPRPSPGSAGPPDRCRAAEERGYQGCRASDLCPHCQDAARFKGYRSKGLLSVLGPLTIERPYYHCPPLPPRPLPRRRHLQGLNERADLTCRTGGVDDLGRDPGQLRPAAGVVLPRMSGLSIAESTVERTTEAIGCELSRAVEAKVVFGEARPWDWHRDADGQTCTMYRWT